MEDSIKEKRNRLGRVLLMKIGRFFNKKYRPTRAYVNPNPWIPYEIDHFLKNKLFDHRDFTFLYFKHDQEDHVLFQTLLLILIDGGSTKYESFLKSLMSRGINHLDFLRRLRQELDFTLNHVPTISENGVTKEANQIFIYPAGTSYGSGESRPTYSSKYVISEIIRWIDSVALSKELVNYKSFIEQQQKPRGFRFNEKKWDQKDLLMVARMLTSVGGIELDKGVKEEDYYRAFCEFHSVMVSKPDQSISMSKGRGTLHQLLKEYLRIQKELDSKIDEEKVIPVAKRKHRKSDIDFENIELT